MPKTTPRSEATPQAPQPANKINYVRCELNAEQKAHMKDWDAETEDMDVMKWIDKMVESGHTISLKCAEVGYQCAVTGVREASGHVNVCLMSRASTPMRSLKVSMFKACELLKGPWPVSNSEADLEY